MSESTRDRPAGAAAAEPARDYEPPRVEKLGSLRDLLAAKTGPGLDPSPVHPWAKK
ncbi:MAG TPA: hypothetical protein VIV59_04675 [Anaeromyxobacteraceae bacterium]